jgi:hypothetical protein
VPAFPKKEFQSFVFEQPANLNKFIDPTLPLTWAIRWQWYRVVLPIWLFSSVCMTEMFAFRLWLNDRSLVANLPLLIGLAAIPPVFLFLLQEIALRAAHASKRVLKLGEKGVSISPAKHKSILWQNVNRWQLEPIPDAVGFCRLTIEYSIGKRSSWPKEWSMALQDSKVRSDFVTALDVFKQGGFSSVPLTELALPSPPSIRRFPSVRPFVALAFAMFFLVHGLPLLFGGLYPSHNAQNNSTGDSSYSVREIAKLHRFLSQHFVSLEQFKRFCRIVGGGMTLAGAVLYFYALRSTQKTRKEYANQFKPVSQ